MKTEMLTAFVLIVALAIASVIFTVLLPDHLGVDGSLLIILMTLSLMAVGLATKRLIELRTPMLHAAPPEALLTPIPSTRHGRQTLVATADPAGPDAGRATDFNLDSNASIVEPMLHDGQFEIRPGVWAYEDGVPQDIVLRHLERRRASAHHLPA